MNDQQRITYAVNTYLAVNRAYWLDFEPPKESRSQQGILVDLLDSHPGHVIGNAVVAKYLQKKYNCKLIAMLPSKKSELQNYVAQSFDFDSYFFYDEEINLSINLDIKAMQEARNMEELRRLVLGFHYQGVPLGDLVYDSYLRGTGCGTVDELNQTLLQYFAQALRDFVYYDAICKQHNVIATVQGHIVYSRFGTMMRAALNNGATVYGRKAAGGPLTLRRYTRMEQCREHEFRLTPEEVKEIYAGHKEKCIAEGKSVISRRFKGENKPEHANLSGVSMSGVSKRDYSRQELAGIIGLDPAKKTICIMSHILPDAPHAFKWMMYNDYYEWLEATLEVAKDVTDVNWIVKEHPELQYYLPKHTATELATRFVARYPHIKMAPTDLDAQRMIPLIDCVVTVSDTAALEFPTQGIPALVAGENAFSGFGFTLEPRTREEYAQALRNMSCIEKLDQEAINRATAYAYMYFGLSRVEMALLPEISEAFWNEIDVAAIYQEAADRLRKYRPEDDPVYQNLQIQLDNALPHLMNYDQLSGKNDFIRRVAAA